MFCHHRALFLHIRTRLWLRHTHRHTKWEETKSFFAQWTQRASGTHSRYTLIHNRLSLTGRTVYTVLHVCIVHCFHSLSYSQSVNISDGSSGAYAKTTTTTITIIIILRTNIALAAHTYRTSVQKPALVIRNENFFVRFLPQHHKNILFTTTIPTRQPFAPPFDVLRVLIQMILLWSTSNTHTSCSFISCNFHRHKPQQWHELRRVNWTKVN